MDDTLEIPVLIIGGGPTGMVAALCLDQLGIGSIVLERQGGLREHPKAHELSGRSIEILKSLGIGYEEMAEQASPYEDACKVIFCNTLAEEYAHIDISQGSGADAYAKALPSPWPFLNISQVELERVIHRRLAAAPKVQLWWNHQWESFEEGPDHVLSQVTNRSTGETLRIKSRYVLCADGAGSRSRQALGVNMVGPDRLRDVVNLYLEADLSDVVQTRGKLYFCLTAEAPGATLIAHHIERRWVLNIPLLGEKSEEDYSDDDLLDLASKALGRDDITLEVKSRSAWRMSAQVADGFRRGRAFLVGDAAHRFPPTGGLGMNSGIGDAHNLSWKLAAVLRGEAPEALLETYEQERRPVIQLNCDQSRANYERLMDIIRAFGLDPDQAEAFLSSLETGPASLLPDGGQKWLRKQANRVGASIQRRFYTDPKVRANVLSTIASQRPHFDRIGLELGYSYDQGALVEDGTPPECPEDEVSIYVPSTRPGSRFPHFWLDGNLRALPSHGLLTPGFSTLLLGTKLAVPEDAAFQALCAAHRVRVRSLGDGAVAPAILGLALRRCQIGPKGALFLRPDDHVAWRQQDWVRPSASLLSSILEQCYGVLPQGATAGGQASPGRS